MIFAILFVLVFLLGAVTYYYTSQWWYGVALASFLFTLNVLLDSAASEYWLISLIFGLPIVFVAALLGAYVVEQRRAEPESVESSEHADSGDTTEDSPQPSTTDVDNERNR